LQIAAIQKLDLSSLDDATVHSVWGGAALDMVATFTQTATQVPSLVGLVAAAADPSRIDIGDAEDDAAATMKVPTLMSESATGPAPAPASAGESPSMAPVVRGEATLLGHVAPELRGEATLLGHVAPELHHPPAVIPARGGGDPVQATAAAAVAEPRVAEPMSPSMVSMTTKANVRWPLTSVLACGSVVMAVLAVILYLLLS